MSYIEDARGAILSGHQSGQRALSELSQAHATLQDAQTALRQGAESSNQPEADEAALELAGAIDKVDEARREVSSALEKFEGVAQHL